MAGYESMTDAELSAAASHKDLDTVPEADREKLQIEWCKRNRVKYTRPDDSVGYEPPGWEGD